MNIQHVKKSATEPSLESWGDVECPLSALACQLRGITKIIPELAATGTGIWECTPGRFRRQIVPGEVTHTLSGRCAFIPDEGPSLAIEAGDTLFFSPNTLGIWDIQETVRKVYVLL